MIKLKSILPIILATVTGSPRYRPELKWSKTWVQNPFRLFEFLFGRKYGIRLEATTAIENGKIVRKFHTIEARLSHYEAQLRAFLGQVGHMTLERQRYFQLGAIAFPDTATGVESSTNPQTFTHTASGSDRLAIVNFNAGPVAATATACSYDGVDCLTNSSTAGNVLGGTNFVTVPGNQNSYMFFLCAPNTTASATVSGTSSAAGYNIMNCSTFSGCHQTSAVIDSSNSGTVSGATSQSVSTTVVKSDCWLVGFFRNTGGVAFTAGAQTTIRVQEPSGGGSTDSNATVSTGSQAQNVTWTGSFNCGAIVASITPPFSAGSSVVYNPTLLLLGIG